MGLAYLNGLMEECTKDNILTIKNMEKDNLFGQIKVNISDHGNKENSNEKVYIINKIKNLIMEYGLKEN